MFKHLLYPSAVLLCCCHCILRIDVAYSSVISTAARVFNIYTYILSLATIGLKVQELKRFTTSEVVVDLQEQWYKKLSYCSLSVKPTSIKFAYVHSIHIRTTYLPYPTSFSGGNGKDG